MIICFQIYTGRGTVQVEDWNWRTDRVLFAFGQLKLTYGPREILRPRLHLFPVWMTECYGSRYWVHWVKLGYSVHAVNHWPGFIYLQATQNSPPGLAIENIFADWLVDQNILPSVVVLCVFANNFNILVWNEWI